MVERLSPEKGTRRNLQREQTTAVKALKRSPRADALKVHRALRRRGRGEKPIRGSKVPIAPATNLTTEAEPRAPRDVIDKQRPRSPSVVRPRDRPEALLSRLRTSPNERHSATRNYSLESFARPRCSQEAGGSYRVPNLEFDVLVVNCHHARSKLDADGEVMNRLEALVCELQKQARLSHP